MTPETNHISAARTAQKGSHGGSQRPHNGWEAVKPHGFWDWTGVVLMVIFGLSFPPLGLIFVACILYIVYRPNESPEQEEARFKAEAEAKHRSRLRWCPNCFQNVRPVRPSPTAGSLLATGGAGYAMRSQTACPICRTEYLQEARP